MPAPLLPDDQITTILGQLDHDHHLWRELRRANSVDMIPNDSAITAERANWLARLAGLQCLDVAETESGEIDHWIQNHNGRRAISLRKEQERAIERSREDAPPDTSATWLE